MKKYLYVILICFLFNSCQNIEFFDYSEKELVDIHTFLPNKHIQYKSAGTHTYKNDTISTYIIDNKYLLSVLKIDGASNSSKIYTEDNVPFNYGNSTYTIVERGNYDVYFDLPNMEKIGAKQSIHLSSDGKIDRLFANDTLQVYSTLFENLTLYYNQKPDQKFFLRKELARVKQLRADVAFYKKNGDLYLMILTLSALENIKEGTILEYLNVTATDLK